ncbi:hypothetical protein BBP18_08880 [Bacillus velezensis]|nr:hypothetical protein CJP14_07165 [Bacillus velezensis]OPD46886.1 hypothetical protein BVF98_04765 [Bacillus amyloliquefaciens]PII42483.1 hypothetical protein BBP18_08880 [Bacillus velezensis]QDK90073.1 hypothetical protein CXB71_09405 [Bacillus velezensis]TCJ49551.1 hypothetical protein EJC52_16375 [Bacillus velezensis]
MLFLIVTFILWRKFFVVLDRERPRSCGLCLSLTIREMKTAAKIPTLSGMMKAAGQMALLKILFFLFMITRKKAGKMRQSIIRPDFLYACLKK